MNKITLQQFYRKNPDSQFLIVFFNVEMIYGFVHHYAMYIQYNGNLEETYFCAKNLIENWNQINLDHKYIFIGYEKIVNCSDIMKQLKSEIIINEQTYHSYFTINL